MATNHRTRCLQPLEVERLIAQDKSLMIIDLRSIEEYMHSHISNATSMASTKQLARHLEGTDRTLHVVLVCTIGDQSAVLVNDFLSLGFTNVFFLAGGMSAWDELQATSPIIPSCSNTFHLH